MQQSSSNTGLVAGSVTLSVISYNTDSVINSPVNGNDIHEEVCDNN